MGGKGASVLEMIKAFEEASGRKVPYEIVGRRAGDVSSAYAACKLAEKELGWKASRGLVDMCRDMWTWQSKKNGFQTGIRKDYLPNFQRVFVFAKLSFLCIVIMKFDRMRFDRINNIYLFLF